MTAVNRIRSAWRADAWRLRTSLIVLMLLGTLLPFVAVGMGFILLGTPVILKEERRHALAEADTLGRHVELVLAGVERRLAQLAPAAALGSAELPAMLEAAFAEGDFQAIYLVDRNGRVLYPVLPPELAKAVANLRGADLSQNPLFRLERESQGRVWSDRYISPVTGQATVGLAIPAGRHVLLGEMRPDFADAIVDIAAEEMQQPVFIVDRAGETVASRRLGESERLRNWSALLALAGAAGDAQSASIRIGDGRFEAGLARSTQLGWTFVTTVPAGFANPRVRSALFILAAAIGVSLLLAAVLAPLWAARLNAPVRALTRRTRELAKSHFSGEPVRGHIRELNELSDDMETMAAAIQQRQRELEHSEERLRATLQTVEQLNIELEGRVERRTSDLAKANRELSETVASLRQAQDELSRSERLAALGKLFVNVADELERPVGSGVMAVTLLRDELRRFRREQAEGSGTATLAHFLQRLEDDATVAENSLTRTAEMIATFRDVAAEPAGGQRRSFELAVVVRDAVARLHNALERNGCSVQVDVTPGLVMDSYPAALERVLANLLSNVVIHAFTGREHGRLTLTAAPAGNREVCLIVSDDGAGIPAELLGRIFDPFLKPGSGRSGTGLGLHGVWHAVTTVLGGTISVASASGRGTTFRIMLPLSAPQPSAP
jgi:signal transduction histidine kinase